MIVAAQRALTLPLLADDVNTVAHVVWRDGALVDLRGNAWTMNGTVPQVARTASMVAGAGPFTDVDFYSLGGGSDLLDFAGDFSGYIVFSHPSTLSSVLLSNGTVTVDGYYLDHDAAGTGSVRLIFNTAGIASVISVTGMVIGAVNLVCFGRSGATGTLKLNLGTYTTGPAGTITPATTTPFRLGRYSITGLADAVDTYYEFGASTSPPSDAACTAAAQRVKQRLGITAW